MNLRLCPGCSYRGEGVPYFRRPVHVGVLLGLALITYGIGGLVYWLVKRDARICPACGMEWHAEPAFAGALAPGSHASASAAPRGRGSPTTALPSQNHGNGNLSPSLPPGGGARRIAGVVLMAMAGIVTALGLMSGAGWYDPWLLGPAALGGLGVLVFWWGRMARDTRRRVLHAHLEQRALTLARERGGALTASEVAQALQISLPAAERVLLSMEDGLRVRSDVTDQGILLFEFPELQAHELPREGTGN